MPGAEPDEELCEMIMRTSVQEALSKAKNGLLPLIISHMSGRDIGDDNPLVRAEIDSAAYQKLEKACGEGGIELNVVKLDANSNVTTFEFPAEHLTSVQGIVNDLIHGRIIAEPLKINTLDDATEEIESIVGLLKAQGVDMHAETDEKGCAVFTIRSDTWDGMVAGLEKATVAHGERIPSFTSLPCTDAMISALKSSLASLPTGGLHGYVDRHEDGSGSLVVEEGEIQNLDRQLGSMLQKEGADPAVQAEAARLQQQLSNIRKSLEDAKEGHLQHIINSAREASAAAERTSRIAKDRNRQVELVR